MIVGKVVGSIVSTRKSEKLIGNKFMIVEPVHHMKAEHSQIVAIDIIGAGIGEYVLVAQGSAARIGCGVETGVTTWISKNYRKLCRRMVLSEQVVQVSLHT